MTKWEYQVQPLSRKFFDSARTLNILGEQGWELVAIIDSYGGPPEAYLKRPIRVPHPAM